MQNVLLWRLNFDGFRSRTVKIMENNGYMYLIPRELDAYLVLLTYHTRDCNPVIPNLGIPESRAFSPISNPGIGGVLIQGFRNHKNELKLYFFVC